MGDVAFAIVLVAAKYASCLNQRAHIVVWNVILPGAVTIAHAPL